jgi:hypothetical protein
MYPAHRNPPPPSPPATNVGRRFPLRQNQLAQANAEISLRNNQRAPIVVDFTYIADLILEVDWNV